MGFASFFVLLERGVAGLREEPAGRDARRAVGSVRPAAIAVK